MSLSTLPNSVPTLQKAFQANAKAGESEGEPDAGNPHVRFEEREVETEHGGAIEAPANERVGNR